MAPAPVIVGEVLFDCFPDGTQVLGGAPFNVAWNLQAFGLQPHFLSAVGEDAEAEVIFKALEAWGIDTSGVQRRADHPSGRVEVAVEAGEPSYTIAEGQAWDAIESVVLGQTPSFLYHGSLAWRSVKTRQSFQVLRGQAAGRVFIDLNVRQPHFSRDWIKPLVEGIHCLKLNLDELAFIEGVNSVRFVDVTRLAEQCRSRLLLDTLIVTAGSEGAVMVNSAVTETVHPAPPVENFVDAVGAGDAFASVVMVGLLKDWEVGVILERASLFAAKVCSLRGATTQDKRFYEETVAGWEL